jgi:hypothetical protein
MLITSEGGKLIQFDAEANRHTVLYQNPRGKSIFGVTEHEGEVYLSGDTFLSKGRLDETGLTLLKDVVPFAPPFRGQIRLAMRWFWTRVGAHARVIPYDTPGLHQLNCYGASLYVTATSWNEIWTLDLDLQLKKRIPLEPYVLNYHHVNNVFCDGANYYVCLNKYRGRPGLGGYAKFDLAWNEVERRAMGWESHALSVIDGHVMQLCCYSWRSLGCKEHPKRAGLMVDGEFVFDYDPQEYFCKDFSVDDDHIYIVGGSNTSREQRASAVGVVFILNRQFQLLERYKIAGLGGFNGCRLRGQDYSKGYAPINLVGMSSTSLDKTGTMQKCER